MVSLAVFSHVSCLALKNVDDLDSEYFELVLEFECGYELSLDHEETNHLDEELFDVFVL